MPKRPIDRWILILIPLSKVIFTFTCTVLWIFTINPTLQSNLYLHMRCTLINSYSPPNQLFLGEFVGIYGRHIGVWIKLSSKIAFLISDLMRQCSKFYLLIVVLKNFSKSFWKTRINEKHTNAWRQTSSKFFPIFTPEFPKHTRLSNPNDDFQNSNKIK